MPFVRFLLSNGLMGVTEKISVNYISMYKSVGLFIEAWLMKICEVGLELRLFFYCRLFVTPAPSELNGIQSGCSVTKA